MIILDISTAVFFYILFSVIAILIIWVIFGYKKIKRLPMKESDSIWKCSVCLHIYVDSKSENISSCPMCGSYNKKGEA